jgi:hypothetical protein
MIREIIFDIVGPLVLAVLWLEAFRRRRIPWFLFAAGFATCWAVDTLFKLLWKNP